MNRTANPTDLAHHVFLDHVPLLRALSHGVEDGYARRHYPVVLEAANLPTEADPGRDPHPIFALCKHEPHAIFQDPRYAAPPAEETPAELELRDQEHRAAIPPEIAAVCAVLTAEEAELAGLCPAHLWEDEALPAITQKGEVVRAASLRLGLRSMLGARAAASATA